MKLSETLVTQELVCEQLTNYFLILFSDGRKKIEEMYHPSCDRSEFYTMSDRTKPPVLFTPSEELDKVIVINYHDKSSKVCETIIYG